MTTALLSYTTSGDTTGDMISLQPMPLRNFTNRRLRSQLT